MWVLCKKCISLVLVLCVMILPVQVFAYGGGGDGGGGDTMDQASAGAGVGGPPLTFTPPDNLTFNIPDSYQNPESSIAGGTPQLSREGASLGDVLSKWLEPKINRLAVKYYNAKATMYNILEHAGHAVKTTTKVIFAGVAFVGAVAGLIALSPVAAGALGVTVAGATVVAATAGLSALLFGASMAAAEHYDKKLGEGKSQTDAAAEGLTSGFAKGLTDHAVNAVPHLGTIDLMQKALTGKGIGDSVHEGIMAQPQGGTPNIGFAPMAPIDA